MSNALPFAERLVFTIRQLREETAAGIEDWTPLIERLEKTLDEEMKSQN